MSKIYNETYDVTLDAAKDTLSRMKKFYDEHPVEDNVNDSVAIFFDLYIEMVVKGWKDLEYSRRPYDYNRQMADHSDVSARHLRRIYNKK